MNELGNTPADKNYKPSGIISEEYPEKVKVAYLQGYEQAEKDLAPLIEAATIVYEAWNGGTMDDVRKAMAELGKRFKEARK